MALDGLTDGATHLNAGTGKLDPETLLEVVRELIRYRFKHYQLSCWLVESVKIAEVHIKADRLQAQELNVRVFWVTQKVSRVRERCERLIKS